MMLIDTHVHLDQIEWVERVIQTALQTDIKVIVAVGMNNASNNTILKLADQFAGVVYPAIGYHPWSIKADEVEKTIKFIESKLDDTDYLHFSIGQSLLSGLVLFCNFVKTRV